MPQHRYRYRTAILVGPWRESRLEAERDAVAARQARFEEGNGGTLIWRCPGTIEADGGDRRNYAGDREG